jgi:phospholipid/cholesterol/gamma-HCH transport system substrate-binding protein
MDQAGITLETLQATLEHADGILAKDARLLVDDVRGAARSVELLAGKANALLSRNEESLDYFANDVVIELGRFLTESRLLVASFSRVVERLETDGARFLIGERDAEFRAK